MAKTAPVEAPVVETEEKPDRAAMLLDGQPTVEAPAETPVVPVETPVETPPARGFLDEVKELGFQDVTDEASASQRLLEAYRLEQKQKAEIEARLQEIQPLARYGTEYVELARNPAFQQFLASKGQPTAEAKPEQPAKWWNPPPIDESAIKRYRDPARENGWKENTPPSVIEAFETRQAHADAWADKLVHNPDEALRTPIRSELVTALQEKDPLVLEALRSVAEEVYGSKVKEQTEEQFWQTVEQEHSNWMYLIDPKTQKPAIDPRTNEYVLSAEGNDAWKWVELGKTIGIQDSRALWEYAMEKRELAQIRAGRAVATATQTAQVTRQEKQTEHLRRGATSRPNRSGGAPPVETPKPRSQNANLSAGSKLVSQLAADGVPV